MGVDRSQYGIQARKFTIISIRTCYRSVCNHPFLVAMPCFLIFLYRSFPFAFSLFISASPVLVCTTILLGTLLSFGQPNIPDIEEEEKATREASSLKPGVAEDTTVVVRDKSFVVEKQVGKRRDVSESSIEDAASVDNRVSEVEDDAGSGNNTPLVDEKSRDIQYEKRVIEEVERAFDDSVLEKRREIQSDKPRVESVIGSRETEQDQHPSIDKIGNENLQVKDENSPEDSSDIHKGEKLDSSLMSAWRRIGHEDEDDNDDRGGHNDDGGDDADDESMDSGSDRAESSSPDASVADIFPMLDELHPLLDLETPQPVQLSHDGSDAASERSRGSSNDGSVDSDEDTENQGEEDNDDDDEEVGGTQVDNKYRSKSVIKWTEDDQKNLMDLGTSELERNQQLENLIARRRAHKNMRLMAEKNLIDLDSANLPFNVPPISATRYNPFDLPHGSYSTMDSPSIPGSAPSILLPRRNPFDLPDESNGEKHVLKGNSSQQDLSALQQREGFSQREAFFRRHESFNVGPSTLGGSRQDIKWKPYFVPEELDTEGTSYHSLRRQLSAISESKMSSVSDNESIGSVIDEEDKELDEQTVSSETELTLNVDHASSSHDEQGSQSSEEIDSTDIEQSENSVVYHDVVQITLGDVESHQEIESNLSEADVTSRLEPDASEIHSRTETIEDDYSSRSSVSSLSTVDEKISDVKGEGSTSSEPRVNHMKESDTCTQSSFEESELNSMHGVVDDNQHKKPVYDTSPPSIEKFLSFSSVSSGTQEEMSELVSPSVLVGSADKEPEVHGESVKQSTSCSQELHTASLEVPNETGSPPVMAHATSSVSSDRQVEMFEVGSPPVLVGSGDKEPQVHGESVEHGTSGPQDLHTDSVEVPNETEPRARDASKITQHDVTQAGPAASQVAFNFVDQTGKLVPETTVEHDSVDSRSSPSESGLADEAMENKEESFHDIQKQEDSLRPDAGTFHEVDQDMSD